MRRSYKQFKSNLGSLLFSLVLATVPGFFVGWLLPKRIPGVMGRFAVPAMQFFFLMIAFMVKDGKKCRKSRISNSVANAGYTWLVTFILHLLGKYAASSINMLSISDNYMNPMGVNLMTMVNVILSMGLVGLSTSRKSLCKKQFNTKFAMLLALVSIMGQGILINEPLQVIQDVVENVIEEVVEVEEILE